MPIGQNGGPNLVKRLIDLNGDAGALVTVTATGPVRAWRVRESIVKNADGSAVTPQGFNIYIPNDGSAAGFTTKFARPAANVTDEPGEFPEFENWNRCSQHGPHGEVFGGAGTSGGGNTSPAGPSGIGETNATVLFKAGSLTATATTIEVTEYF